MCAVEICLTRIDMVVVGGLSAHFIDACSDYERRIRRYVSFEVHELKAEPLARGKQLVLRAEEARISRVLDRLELRSQERTTLVALDVDGDVQSTDQLVERWLGVRHLVLLIGGSMGLPTSILDRSHRRVSFGRATMPHQIARLIATEQIYRCWRIARGEPYHY